MNPQEHNISQRAAQHLETLLKLMGVSGTLEEGALGDTLTLTIRTPEAGVLIGEDGARLQALNHMIRRIMEHELGHDSAQILVDVNDYRRKQYEELRDQARMGAPRVRYFKKEVVLAPMSAFERRIVHVTLQEYPDITTESTGEGHARCVVIRPYP